MASCHHSLSNLDELVALESSIWLAIAPGKRRDVFWSGLGSVDVRTRPDYASRREHRTDSGLGVVADHGSEKLQSRVADSFRGPQLHGTIGVLEIARSCARAKVHPSPDV